MNSKSSFRVTLSRVIAEVLSHFSYRSFQKYYWRLRSDEIAVRYDFTEDLPVLAEIIKKFSIQSILDVGCGTGRLFPAYSTAGATQVWGLEISESLFRKAQEAVLRLGSKTKFNLLVHDLRVELPAETKADLMVSARVLQHIDAVEIKGVVAKLMKASPRVLYINELMESEAKLPHIFRHDYERLFEEFGFKVSARGKIPGNEYEYLVFIK